MKIKFWATVLLCVLLASCSVSKSNVEKVTEKVIEKETEKVIEKETEQETIRFEGKNGFLAILPFEGEFKVIQMSLYGSQICEIEYLLTTRKEEVEVIGAGGKKVKDYRYYYSQTNIVVGHSGKELSPWYDPDNSEHSAREKISWYGAFSVKEKYLIGDYLTLEEVRNIALEFGLRQPEQEQNILDIPNLPKYDFKTERDETIHLMFQNSELTIRVDSTVLEQFSKGLEWVIKDVYYKNGHTFNNYYSGKVITDFELKEIIQRFNLQDYRDYQASLTP